MFFMIKPEFSNERWFIRRGNGAPFIKEIENTQPIVINKFNDSQIIREINFTIFIGKSFMIKDFFFLLKNSMKINLMKSFIGVIDEKLLQTVWLKNLETVNIKESKVYDRLILIYMILLSPRRRQYIQLVDYPMKEFLIQTFCQRMNKLLYLSCSEMFCHYLTSDFKMIRCQCFSKLFNVHL